MKRVAIIGGGIVGASTAYFLSQTNNANGFEISVFDQGTGQATKAASGIISPWLSKRRNKKWFKLAKNGAALVPKMARNLQMDKNTFKNDGTLISKKDPKKLSAFYEFAKNRANKIPEMKAVELLTPEETIKKIPALKRGFPSVFVEGGSHINGASFCQYLLQSASLINTTLYSGKATLIDNHHLSFNGTTQYFDEIIVATGAFVPETLKPLGITTKVRPQKGELIVLSSPTLNYKQGMPVLMPESDFDYLLLPEGKLIVGASHDDLGGFSLARDEEVEKKLFAGAEKLFKNLLPSDIVSEKVGTRAFTNDYSPFFGRIPKHESIMVASGLGSSGLTTGPEIGRLLANEIAENKNSNFSELEKPLSNYLD